MKKNIIKIISVCFILLIIPLSLILSTFCIPTQFGYTYYGVLPKMYNRLKQAEGKKITLVGCSALAFGLNVGLLQDEFSDYTICPFGLYGSIGTKAMMDLSKVNIAEGDIVVLAPELSPQSLSLYFNGEYIWKSIDGNFEMLQYVDWDDMGGMTASLPSFASEKFNYWSSGEDLIPSGVYAASSFDENCSMIYERPYNIMQNGYMGTELISYDTSIYSADFIAYINEYNEYVESKGATLVYAFSPVNDHGISKDTDETVINDFYNFLDNSLECSILGSPFDYLMEREWFYDSNVHCNALGAVVYTRQIAKDLKVFLEDPSPVGISMPEKPALPEQTETIEGNNEDVDMFVYEQTDDGYKIVGLSEEGSARTSLVLPTAYNGKAVTGFSADTFAGNTVIEEIRLQKNIRNIENYSFNGCVNLERLYLAEGESPERCTPGQYFLDGADNCRVYVQSSLMIDYLNNYFWSKFSSFIEAY